MNRAAEALPKHIDTIRHILISLKVPPEDREDLAQDVLLAAWEQLVAGGFQEPPGVPWERPFRSWLYGIAWRQTTTYLSRPHRRREVLVSEPRVYAAIRDDAVVQTLEARSALRCLPRLGPVAVHLLEEAMGSDVVQEIASVERISRRAVSYRLSDARRAFAELVGADEDCPPPSLTKEEAYRRLLATKMRDDVCRWLTRLKVHPDDVPDVAQEVLIGAIRGFGKYSPHRSHIERWVSRIAVRKASHYHQRAFRRYESYAMEHAPEMPDPHPGPGEQLEQEEVRGLVLECLAFLDPSLRQILVALYLHGIPLTEIAEQRGMSLAAAYRHHTRARHALRRALLERMRSEEDPSDSEEPPSSYHRPSSRMPARSPAVSGCTRTAGAGR